MKDTRVKVNQTEFQLQDYEQTGEAIIFLRFGGSNLMMWQHIVPSFQDRYHAITLDLRGSW